MSNLSLAVSLHNKGKFLQALALYNRIDSPEALFNRGAVLLDLRRLEEALNCYDQFLALSPEHAKALSNRGLVLHQFSRFDEELESYNHALHTASYEDLAEIYYNRAQVLLLRGDLEQGFRDFEWRLKRPSEEPRKFNSPPWAGQDIRGRKLLVHAEQGFGDTIQFCRYVELVANMGADVIFEVPPELVELMCSLDCDVGVVSQKEILPYYDYHCALMSLPFRIGTTLQSIPNSNPYLFAASDKVNLYKQRFLGPKKKIGLCWSSNPLPGLHRVNWIHKLKSFDCNTFSDLMDNRFEFYSLQKGMPASLELFDYTANIRDFSDTAALIENLDLVISVDTAVAHLAGALGKPVWIFVPNNCCWRWLLDTDKSPWYPTARIFRQQCGENWSGVIKRVQQELERVNG